MIKICNVWCKTMDPLRFAYSSRITVTKLNSRVENTYARHFETYTFAKNALSQMHTVCNTFQLLLFTFLLLPITLNIQIEFYEVM